jgi:hypothetical protein
MWIEAQPHPWIEAVLLRKAHQEFSLKSVAARDALSAHIQAALYWWRVAATRLSGPPDGSGVNVPLLQKMAGIL